MITKAIKDRMDIAGITQAEMAAAIGCAPTQFGLFLKGKTSLNRESLEKCFHMLGIQLETITKRIELAKKIAQKLQNFSIEYVSKMDRESMIRRTGVRDLKALPEVTKQEFEIMISSGIGEYEGTFQYFKTLVLHCMKSSDGFSPKKVEKSLNALAGLLVAVPLVAAPLMPVLGIGSLIGAAVGAFAVKNTNLSRALNNAWGSLTTLTLNQFK